MKNDNPQTPKEFDLLFDRELNEGESVETIISMIVVAFKHKLLFNDLDVYLNKTLVKYPHDANVLLFLCHYYLNEICEDDFPYELDKISEIHADPTRKLALNNLTQAVSKAIIQHPHESQFLYLKAVTHFWNEDFASSELIMCYLLHDREETEDCFYTLCAYSFFHLNKHNQVIQVCLQDKGERSNEIPLSYILLTKSWIATKEFDLAIKLTSTLMKDFDNIQNKLETARINSVERKSLLHRLNTCKQVVVDLITLCNIKQHEQENQSIYEQILSLINNKNLKEAQEKLDNYTKLLLSLGESLSIEAKIKQLYLAALIKYKQKKYTEVICDIDTFFFEESIELAAKQYDQYFEITKDLFEITINCLKTQKGTDAVVANLLKIIKISFTSNQIEFIKWVELFCESAINAYMYKEALDELNTDDIWKATPSLQSAYIKVNIELGNYDIAEQTCDYIKSLFGAAFCEYLYFKSLIAYASKEYSLALAYIEAHINSHGQDEETANLRKSILKKLAKDKQVTPF